MGWTIFAIYVVVPAFASGSSPFFGYYASVGGSPAGVVKTLFTDPGAITSTLFTWNLLQLVVGLGAPLAGLFVLSPALTAVALPAAPRERSFHSPVMTEPRHRCTAAMVPFLVAATVLGVARLTVARRAFAATLVLAACTALSLVFGAWPFALQENHFWYGAKVPTAARLDALRRAVAVGACRRGGQLHEQGRQHICSARRCVDSVRVVGRADWVVLDIADPFVSVPGSPCSSATWGVGGGPPAPRARRELAAGLRPRRRLRIPAEHAEHVRGRVLDHAARGRRVPGATRLVWCASAAVGARRLEWDGRLVGDPFAAVRSRSGLELAGFDLGNMVQAVWSTAHGRPLEMTSFTTGSRRPARLPRRSDPRRC